MNVRSLVLALAAALLLTTACAAHRQLRTSVVPVDVTAPLSDPRARAAVATTSIERYPGYTIAIVEFDDQGRFWDRKQVAAVLGEITREARTDDDAGVGMLVYVHGWRDDARVCDKALVAFREFVRRISVDDLAKLPGRHPLIGIYVAWRGYSSHVWPFEYFSIIGRKEAATRIASGDVPEFLSYLDSFWRELNATRKEPSRLVVIGHSLGGTIVFESIANIYKARLGEAWPGVDVNGTSRVVSGFGDLVLLVNPAFEAERWHSIHELAASYASFSKQQKPLLVVAASETDLPNLRYFPFAQRLGTMLQKTRDEEQRRAVITAIGQYQPFVTHHLRRGDLPPDDRSAVPSDVDIANCVANMPPIPPAPDLSALFANRRPADDARDEGWGAQPCIAERHIGPLLLTCGPNVQRGNPFWVVRVAPNVLHQHNGYFNPYFLYFAREFVLGTLE
jgi:pimeloyl-ACP methyl ester carboxylesterase